MAKTAKELDELAQLKEYLVNPGREKANDHLVFPIFKKLFGAKFKKESDAQGADIYIEGKLLVELKSKPEDAIKGFYQGMHYAKQGLTFSAICVIAKQFIAIWKVNQLPDFAKKLIAEADPNIAPNEIGGFNARKTSKADSHILRDKAAFILTPENFEGLYKSFDVDLPAFVQALKNLEADRIQINPFNFIEHIEQLKRFFDDPLEAIHCFYSIVGYWDISSYVGTGADETDIRVISRIKSHNSFSDALTIKPRFFNDFKNYIEHRFVFTNEGSGLTADYYFSRFDEVITKIKPEYAKQHGIFFTDGNLSKFALWFVHEYFEKRLGDKYIVFDPAGGSGNLVTSWKGHLKHKIVSELQPDLLKTIERRMKLDPEQIEGGFTIIPRTTTSEGLNFLDKSAEEYFRCLMKDLSEKNFKFDKPIAFLLNPPYKNTDENREVRTDVDAEYKIHSSIIKMTGNDAGKERYLAFLGQIINIARVQMGDLKPTQLNFEDIQLPVLNDLNKVTTPLILIFTPTSWLIPRPTYKKFRKVFDKYFKYEMGFIFLGNEFFKIKGRFPISFTIWSYNYQKKGNENKVVIRDFTNLTNAHLRINWNRDIREISENLKLLVKGTGDIAFNNSRGDIRSLLPLIKNHQNGKAEKQPRYNIYRNARQDEANKPIISGFPLKDSRHSRIKAPHGFIDGTYIGFMDDNTPVRLRQENLSRMSNRPDRVWFRLDNDLKSSNKTRLLCGAPDKYGYCAYDSHSAIATFTWFAITKAINNKYPLWANQFDVWAPCIPKDKENYFYSLCFAFGLAENRCVVTKFEKDNPVPGAPEIYIDNPLCPINPESFWSTTLDKEIVAEPYLASDLVESVRKLYKTWNHNHCKGQILHHVGLQDEPYFKYFDYADFLTPYSGLIQIKKYAETHMAEDILIIFKEITEKTKAVREEIYRMLVEDFKYFE